jgi:hypothetical protein
MGMSEAEYTTTVLTSPGDLFEVSFIISCKADGVDEQVIRMERVEAKFECDEQARAAGQRAAIAFIDRIKSASCFHDSGRHEPLNVSDLPTPRCGPIAEPA